MFYFKIHESDFIFKPRIQHRTGEPVIIQNYLRKYAFKSLSSSVIEMVFIFPSIANDILPFSSETQMAAESVASEIPRAARWRKP
jgi:hypothetical protein